MALRAFRVLLLAAAVLAGCVSPARAFPPANAYAKNSIRFVEPNAHELKILEHVHSERRRRGLGALEWDGRLSAVARQHSEDMAEHGYFAEVSPRLGDMEYRLHRAGVSLPNVRSGIHKHGSVDALIKQLAEQERAAYLGRENRIGIGVVETGRPAAVYATIVAMTVRTDLDPFPTMPIYGEMYRLSGKVDRGLSDLNLVVTVPGGEVEQEAVAIGRDRSFEAFVTFDRGRGEYVVGLTASGALGPMVLDLMKCYAGVPYPAPEARAAEETPSDLRRAERDMLRLVNRSRREAGAKPLVFDDLLAKVARDHSHDMVRNGFFAHTSPTRGDLGARMGRAGVAAKSFGECIANTKTLEAAHRGLMGSPAHRRSILSPEFDRVGIGIVADGSGGIMVTEVFAQDFEEHDPRELADRLARSINDARRAKGLAPLRLEATLSEIARENSQAMAREGRPGHDVAARRLEALRLRYAVQIGVAGSSDPPTLQHFQKYADENLRALGVGVAQSGAEDPRRTIWTTVIFGE